MLKNIIIREEVAKIKKIPIILIILFLIIVFSMYALFLNKRDEQRHLQNYNQEYESYLNRKINGVELATLINKVVNLNEKNNIKKDTRKYYIENDENSIKVQIKIIDTDKTYAMEEIYKNDTSEFVKFFGQEEFECTKIEYHAKTGKVKNMFFEQVNL